MIGTMRRDSDSWRTNWEGRCFNCKSYNHLTWLNSDISHQFYNATFSNGNLCLSSWWVKTEISNVSDSLFTLSCYTWHLSKKKNNVNIFSPFQTMWYRCSYLQKYFSLFCSNCSGILGNYFMPLVLIYTPWKH